MSIEDKEYLPGGKYYTPETNGGLTLPQAEFQPRPEVIFQDMVDMGLGGLKSIVLHGSYVYLNSVGPLNTTYHEERVYQEGQFIESRFTLVKQPPDVDIVAIVDNLDGFDKAFQTYIEEHQLLTSLNHFIEMTVITPETLEYEIRRQIASGMKTIFGLKPHIVIGDQEIVAKAKEIAKAQISQSDIDFQEQYERRKLLYRSNGTAGAEEFIITREQYEMDYPEMLRFYDTGSTSAFPERRLKITLPRPLKLRSWKYLDALGNEINILNQDIND